MPATIYLIPTELYEGITAPLPAYLVTAIQACSEFYVENERTARRAIKRLWKEFPVDSYGWHNMKEGAGDAAFRESLKRGATVGILSEAGCPGVADPGAALVAIAQEAGALVRPLSGPSSILLALMASGMNGQGFSFHGYLPIEQDERARSIRSLEGASAKSGATQIFIETPYRNGAMWDTLLRTLHPATRLCIAVDLTAPTEWVRTMRVQDWKKAEAPQLHKRPCIFLLQA